MLSNLNQYKNSFKYYTELRVQENRSFRVGLLNGNLVTNDQSVESGVSSRVFKDGDWGFCSNAEINKTSIDRVIKSSSDNASFLNQKKSNKMILWKILVTIINLVISWIWLENNKTSGLKFMKDIEKINKILKEVTNKKIEEIKKKISKQKENLNQIKKSIDKKEKNQKDEQKKIKT